uniref:PqqD family protein n=1 Tax=Rhabditophanes sp. KR3021 TaxID=114890 RepID=A0AC35TR54_9BILA
MSFKIRKAKKSKGSSSSRSSRKVRPSKIRPIDEGFVEYFTISENVYPQDRVEYGVVADIYPLSIEFVLEFCNHLKHFQYEDALKQIDKIKKEFEAEDTDFADYWTQIIDWGFIQVNF